jgi:hypothetical protein
VRVVTLLVVFHAFMFHASSAWADESCNQDRTQCCEWWSIQVTSANRPTGLILEDSFEKLQRRLASDEQTGAKLCRYFGPSEPSCSTKYGAPTCAMGNQPSKCDGAPAAFDQWTAQLQTDLTNVAKLESPYTKLRDAVTQWTDKAKDKIGDADTGETGGETENPFEHVGSVLDDYKEVLSDAMTRVRTAQSILGRVVNQGTLFINPYMNSLGDPSLLSLWNTQGGFSGADEKDAANCEIAAVEQTVKHAANLRPIIAQIVPPTELPIRSPIERVTIAKTSKTSRVVIAGWQSGKPPPALGSYPIAWLDGRRKPHYNVSIEVVLGSEGRTRIKVTAGPTADPTILYFDGWAPDLDRDGFIDARDSCPNEAGLAPNGCPPSCPAGTEWTDRQCVRIEKQPTVTTSRPAAVSPTKPPPFTYATCSEAAALGFKPRNPRWSSLLDLERECAQAGYGCTTFLLPSGSTEIDFAPAMQLANNKRKDCGGGTGIHSDVQNAYGNACCDMP